MRYISIALMLICIPAGLMAQQPPSLVPPLPPIGLPLPQIGLPATPHQPGRPQGMIGLSLPPIGLSAAPRQPPHPHRNNRPAHGGKTHVRHRPAIVFFGASFSPFYEPSAPAATAGVIAPAAPPVTSQPSTGRLRVDVEPADAQLFVDGEYAGTPRDGGEIDLEAGTRRLEIRAPGYETLVVDVKIGAERTITYRGVLNPLTEPPAEAPPPIPPARSSTSYFLPGCYVGNVPPDQVKLPAGCDLRQLIVYTP